MIEIKGLNQYYGGSHILWDVDMKVPAGARLCLMGRNGVGKTTLLKCIMGLLPAATGELGFDGCSGGRCAWLHPGVPNTVHFSEITDIRQPDIGHEHFCFVRPRVRQKVVDLRENFFGLLGDRRASGFLGDLS